MRWSFCLSFFLAMGVQAQPVRAPSLKVTGSPELGKPFLSERAFPQQVFKDALDLVPLPGAGRLLVVERRGQIWSISLNEQDAERKLFADIKALHPETEYTYAVQFHPRFKENRQVFITYVREKEIEDGSTLSRFTVVGEGADQKIDPASEVKLIHWRSGGHNGAALQFGPDGYLYLSTGDSEVPAPPDPLNTGQDLDDLLCCVLRLDVDHADDGKAYAVPKDNPFVSTPGARPEIWAYGFRNPWKMAFDRQSGRLWVGDVGWELWEMVHLVKRGGNYGWSAMEASQPVKPDTKGPEPISPPIVAHSHAEAASITGGFVYRGKQFPELTGAYLYGDYETGKVWALWHDGNRILRHEEICDTPHKIVTFGETEDGDLYYAHYSGESTLHRFVRNPQAGKPSSFPKKLSETGLFTNTSAQTPADGVVHYEISVPMWADGAAAERYVALPEGAAPVATKIQKNGNNVTAKTTWPKDAVLAKTLSIETEVGKAETRKKLETQLLHFDGVAWQGYSYRWNEAGTDAELVQAEGDQLRLILKDSKAPGGERRYDHRFHSRAECMRCHTTWTNFVNGFTPQQLKQPEQAVESGIVDADYLKQSEARLVNPHDKQVPLEARARSWLHANCAHCHRQNGGGSVAVVLNAELPVGAMKAVNETPLRGTFGIADARIIAAGSPGHSALLHRLAVSGAGHMPIVGSREADVEGLKLLSEWIAGLPQPEGIKPFSKEVAGATDSAVKQWMALAAASQGDLDEAFHVLIADSPANALRLLNYIDAGDAVPSIVKETLARTETSSSGQVRALYERFLPHQKREQLLGPNVDKVALLKANGDASRGAELLAPTGKAGACLACHFVAGNGRDFGPDLSKVGAKLNKEQLLDSILKPSAAIAEGFAAVVVTQKDGMVQTGFVVRDDAQSLTLKLATGQSLDIGKSDIASRQQLPVSLMPEGQLQAFTAQEAADLLSYLASLK